MVVARPLRGGPSPRQVGRAARAPARLDGPGRRSAGQPASVDEPRPGARRRSRRLVGSSTVAARRSEPSEARRAARPRESPAGTRGVGGCPTAPALRPRAPLRSARQPGTGQRDGGLGRADCRPSMRTPRCASRPGSRTPWSPTSVRARLAGSALARPAARARRSPAGATARRADRVEDPAADHGPGSAGRAARRRTKRIARGHGDRSGQPEPRDLAAVGQSRTRSAGRGRCWPGPARCPGAAGAPHPAPATRLGGSAVPGCTRAINAGLARTLGIGGQDGSPGQVGGLDRGQVERHPPAAVDEVDRTAVDLDLASADLALAGDQPELSAPRRGGHHEASR